MQTAARCLPVGGVGALVLRGGLTMPVEFLGAPCPTATATGAEWEGRREIDLVALLSAAVERRCFELCSKRTVHAKLELEHAYYRISSNNRPKRC